jgi:hypothetical protein
LPMAPQNHCHLGDRQALVEVCQGAQRTIGSAWKWPFALALSDAANTPTHIQPEQHFTAPAYVVLKTCAKRLA